MLSYLHSEGQKRLHYPCCGILFENIHKQGSILIFSAKSVGEYTIKIRMLGKVLKASKMLVYDRKKVATRCQYVCQLDTI